MRIRFSPMLATGSRTLIPTLAAFSIFLLVVGHDIPGGGFAGGLIIASALLMIFLAFGERGVRLALPFEPEAVTGVGLGAAILGGVLGWLAESAFLAYATATLSIPLIGDVKLTTLLLFDVGVYLIVLGLVGTAVVRLGGDLP